MKWTMTILMICSIFAIQIACSGGNQKTITEVEQEQIAKAEEEVEVSEEESLQPSKFDGTIKQTESGLSLQTGAGEFIIEGQDLSDMVGKKVQVIGALEESTSGKKINITSITPME